MKQAIIKNEIRSVPIAELQPAPYNPRKISKQALKGLAASIKRFGLVQPIVVNKRTNLVVGGHQRLEALKVAGETTADVLFVDLSDPEEKALNDCGIYVWAPSLAEGYAIHCAVVDSGFKVQSQLIWRKTPFVMGRADYHWQHEVCWYGFKGRNHPWYGGRTKSTVRDVPKPQRMDKHPTMKPVALSVTAINNSSRLGDVVLDLFGGSGSTLIGCQQTERRCVMAEISPAYCDVIIERFEKFTGAHAKKI